MASQLFFFFLVHFSCQGEKLFTNGINLVAISSQILKDPFGFSDTTVGKVLSEGGVKLFWTLSSDKLKECEETDTRQNFEREQTFQ
jgi:hypothetical protein